MSQQSTTERLRLLQERFDHEMRSSPSVRTAESPAPPFGGQTSRPGSGRSLKPFKFEARPPPQTTETDVRMREVYKRSGKLNINGVEYHSQVSDLKQLSELGFGSCGQVFEMLHIPSNTVIAVKQMRRSGNNEETKRILMDLDIVVRSHDCQYIVRCLGCFVTDTDVWICMELMSSCFDKLLKRVGAPIPEGILGKVTYATVNALSYLKETHGVIHRDVKPSNILLDSRGNIKLCDFGISGRLVDSKAKTRSAGCAAYMAPERIDPPDPARPDYDIRADVWSLGISLVELATGVFPYRDCQNDFEVLTRVIEDAPPTLPENGSFGQEFKDFVKLCLTKDYRDRPKYAKLLKHPFITKAARSDVSVAAWYAGLPGATPPAPPARVPSAHTTAATHTAVPRSDSYQRAPPRPAYPPPQLPQTQQPNNSHTNLNNHLHSNGLSATSRVGVPQSSPLSPPPAHASPRLPDRLVAAPSWMHHREEHGLSRPRWTSSRAPSGSSSQPTSLEAELANYSPYPGRRTLDACASPPPVPARRVSVDSRWRPSPAVSGDTSPLLLQRFHHQSQQRRSRADLTATPRNHRSLSQEHSAGRSPEPPPRSSRQMLGHDANGTIDTEREAVALHERLQLHERLNGSGGRSQSLTRTELRNGWRVEPPAHPAPHLAHPSPPASAKLHRDDQGWLHSLAGLVKRRLTHYVKWHHVVGTAQPAHAARPSRTNRWGPADSWSVPASPLPPRAPPPRPAD